MTKERTSITTNPGKKKHPAALFPFDSDVSAQEQASDVHRSIARTFMRYKESLAAWILLR